MQKCCPVCGEKTPSKFSIYFDDYLTLYRCGTCSFVAQYPEENKNTVMEDYEHYYSLDFVNTGKKFQYPERTESFIDMANRIVGISGANSKVLDVGAGEGHFMSVAEKRGLQCVGVEPSPILADYAASIVKGEIKKGYYTKKMFPAESFDVITFIQVLEHLVDPGAALDAAWYHLKPGGFIMVEVPSIWAPHFLMYRLTGLKKFVKPPTGVIFSHVGYFSPRTLALLAQLHKFKKRQLITGRWFVKYHGLLKLVAFFVDPILNTLRIGGILYFGKKY